MTTDNREKFMYLAGRYGQLVKFYNVEELCADRIAEIRKYFPNSDKTHFTIGTFYRVFIPFVLPATIEKAIYLDCDIIATLDINEFWQIDLADKPLGVMSSAPISLKGIVKEEDYFNAGVLLMNLNILRKEEETVKTGMKFFSENPQHLRWGDQCLLNYCFATRTMKLPQKFNSYIHYERNQKASPGRKIYHYIGDTLFNGMDTSDAFNRLWMSYFIRTPFFDEDSMGRLYNAFLQVHSDLKNSALKLSAIMSGKTRAFFVEPAKVDFMKKIFSICDDEIIIPAENEQSIQKLTEAMKLHKGKCVFFVMTEKLSNKNFPFDLLTKEGFIEAKDFVKGWQYLDSPLNSYSLIQAM
ncbi:MAG: hypothetical protein IJK81_11990 [Selenomonadaceae bacterium]|nr:hypothetical protein [Selenomonadaceae bacterium]